MTWILWVVVAIIALGATLNIANIGKEREPLTPGVVAISTVFNAFFIWAIVAVGIYG